MPERRPGSRRRCQTSPARRSGSWRQLRGGLTEQLTAEPSAELTTQAGLSYIDAEGNSKTVSSYTTLTSSSNSTLKGGWYAVKGNVTIKNRLMIASGRVNLILCDGATLTAKKGITVNKTTSLVIWQQSKKTGKLVATTTGDHVSSISVNTGSNLVVNGGTITAMLTRTLTIKLTVA